MYHKTLIPTNFLLSKHAEIKVKNFSSASTQILAATEKPNNIFNIAFPVNNIKVM